MMMEISVEQVARSVVPEKIAICLVHRHDVCLPASSAREPVAQEVAARPVKKVVSTAKWRVLCRAARRRSRVLVRGVPAPASSATASRTCGAEMKLVPTERNGRHARAASVEGHGNM